MRHQTSVSKYIVSRFQARAARSQEGKGRKREQATYRLTVVGVRNSLADKLGGPLLVRVIRAGRYAWDDERHLETKR